MGWFRDNADEIVVDMDHPQRSGRETAGDAYAADAHQTDLRIERALSALTEFSTLMYEWESRLHEDLDAALHSGAPTDELMEEATVRLREIFGAFVLPDGKNYGRLDGLAAMSPPEYDPHSDVIEAVHRVGRAVVVTTRQAGGLQSTFRFTLVEREDRWVIQKKQLLNYKDAWQRSTI